jgi:hypothetical protein
MGHPPIIRELQQLTKPTARQVKAEDTMWARFVAIITSPDLLAIVAFCAIGILLILNLIFRFPDFGTVIEQYNQF